MLKIAEILQQKGQTIRLFLFLVPYIRFLFASLKRIRQFSSIFDQISECSKLLKHFTKRDRRFLFLVPFIRFLFESLKLFRQFPLRFDQISGCSKLLKYFNIFQKLLLSSKFFLFHTNVF